METTMAKKPGNTMDRTGTKTKTNEVAAAVPKGTATAPESLSTKSYNRELKKLHVELVKLQQWVVHEGLKVCIVFEGRDGAGKGGTIKAITERVSPRVFRVVALPAPTEREKTQMYGQRYMAHFPAAGEVVIFDRSWYNRAGVEHVMGFCTKEEYKRFMELCPVVEKYIVDDIAACPLRILNYPELKAKFKASISTFTGVKFSDKLLKNPFTQNRLLGAIPLGTHHSHVTVGNYTLAKLIAGGKIMGNVTELNPKSTFKLFSTPIFNLFKASVCKCVSLKLTFALLPLLDLSFLLKVVVNPIVERLLI